MTPEEWHKIKEVLQTALELDPHARGNFLDSACAGQSSMRSEVESLLESHEQDKAFLEQPAAIDAVDVVSRRASAAWIGRHLGPYELLEEIGEGGMGAVYRAVRADGMYDKQVAIKLIRTSLSTDYFVSRFKNERQILAGFEHPNIARLLDGGVTEDGLPFVVLEFVAGVPIDQYCALHDLSVTDRLKLFRTVCSAVQYAHQNLVVHRDLKPGNILVTEDGIPKLLDFGIAKILDPQQEENEGDRTLTVMRIMTPDFASPEQVRGESITTSSDVYSLGVILYVLLTGRRPYRMSSTAPHEMIKAICDTDPEKPSTAVTQFEKRERAVKADAAPSVAREAEPHSKREKLRRALAGDLDNIVLKALRKEPERRYATVEQLSEDVRRHLEHLPVIARKDTPGYRTAKFIQRHKAGVAATAAVVLVLIAGLLITLREAHIARANEIRAEHRFNDVRQLANSLIFDVHDSIKDLPGSTPARKIIVDRALQYLSGLAQESGGDLALQRELATAYERVGLVQGHYLQNSLGDTQGSLITYQKALQLREQVEAKSRDWNDRLALAQAHRLVANQQWATGDNRAARENLNEAIAISEALNKTRPNDSQVLYELGFDYEVSGDIGYSASSGGGAKAKDDYRNALTVDEAILRINPDDFHALDGYATDLSKVGGSLERTDPDAALAYFEKELEIEQKLHQRSRDIRYARGVALTYGHMASVYGNMGDYPRALENDSRDLAIYQELIRVDPQNSLLQQGLAIQYVNTATQLGRTGKLPLSLTYMDKGLEIMRAIVASSPQNTPQRRILGEMYRARASNLLKLHEPKAALKDLENACAIHESFHKADASDIGASINAAACIKQMGIAAALSGDSRLAANYFHQALAVVEPALSARVPELDALYTAADAYSGLGDLKLKDARIPGQSVAHQRANWADARSSYLKSLENWHRIKHPNHSAPNGFDVGDPANVAKNLQLCDAELARAR
jgi:serine/threonine protein kinase